MLLLNIFGIEIIVRLLFIWTFLILTIRIMSFSKLGPPLGYLIKGNLLINLA